MNQNERSQLANVILTTAKYYNKPVDRDMISMMVDDLSEFDFEKIMVAYKTFRLSPENKFFPLPAQIISIVKPTPSSELLSREIASRITGAVTKFGYSNTLLAKEFIGELGWKVVERKGGWSYICENLGLSLDPGTFEAQARELAKTELVKSTNPEFGLLLDSAIKRMPELNSEEKQTLQIQEGEK